MIHRNSVIKFDPLNLPEAIAVYRLVVARRSTATSHQERLRLEAISQSLRTRWKVWNGRDELHELAFGNAVGDSWESDTLPG